MCAEVLKIIRDSIVSKIGLNLNSGGYNVAQGITLKYSPVVAAQIGAIMLPPDRIVRGDNIIIWHAE
jgi:hypothetical protein